MKDSLKTIILTGSRQCKATNWMIQPGHATAELTSGRTVYCGDVSPNAVVQRLKQEGVDCSAYEARAAEASKPFEPSSKEQSASFYQKGYGYEVPERLGKWDFSTTFGRWGRTVTFADGTTVFTYPKPF